MGVIPSFCSPLDEQFCGSFNRELIDKNNNKQRISVSLHPPHNKIKIQKQSVTDTDISSHSSDKIYTYRVTSYDVESEFGTIPDIPENYTLELNEIKNMLIAKGFNITYVRRGIFVYEKHYTQQIQTNGYDMAVIEEIIYRLTIKDRLKQLKSVQNLYQSRDSVEQILRDLNFSIRYINLALLLYEVMAEMFEISKYHENIYDLELISEMIMRLRSKFTEFGDMISTQKKHVQNNVKIYTKQQNEKQKQNTCLDLNDSLHSVDDGVSASPPSSVEVYYDTDKHDINDGEQEEKYIVDSMDRLSTIRSDQQIFEGRINSLRIPNNKMDKMAQKAIRIEQEIMETEKSYICGLHVLMDEFLTPIFDDKLLHESYKKEIICNLPQIISFHEIFYQELISGSMAIAQVFNKQSDYFKMYIEYVSQYKNILNIFAKNKKHKRLERFLSQKRIHENKTLISYLILPIQRVPRYMLLLNELLKKTPQQSSEYTDIAAALKKVELICAEINNKQRDIENMSQLMLITNKLKGLNINIIEPQRKYIQLFIFKRKNDKQIKQFFIFNDIVIVSDLKWKTEQVVKLTTFEAKRPSKSKNKEVLIRIQDNTPISYVSILQNEINEPNQPIVNENNISDIELFCQVLVKYRSMLYEHSSNRAKTLGVPSHSSDHEEQEKNKLAQWQQSNSKGNKNKVLKMLKSPSENTIV